GRVADRLDHALVPEQRAVGAVVAHQHARRFALADGVRHAGARFLVAVGTLQDAQVAAEQRRRRIAAHLSEGGIHEHHRTVWRHGIADHDAFAGALHHAPPGVGGPVIHALPPGSRVRAGAAVTRARSSRARCQSAEASSAGRSAAPARPCRRTRRRLEAGSGSWSSPDSSSRTLARLLQTGSMSQPADRARRARATMFTYAAAAPPMDRSSANTTP